VEAAGWDGISVWDHILVWDGNEVADPWIMLAAAASVTDRITLMSMVTPIPRRHPWKLAREAVSVDLLSEGRLVLGVGTGWPTDPEFTRFGGETDLRRRADMLDEGLAILDGLWSGEPFGFRGEHYELDEVTFLPRPLQRPRIPIWVAGMWPRRRPMRRAARWDGVAPIFYDFDAEDWRAPSPQLMGDVASYIAEHRPTMDGYDIAVAETHTPGTDLADTIAAYEAAGVTWWRDGWVPGSETTADEWHASVLGGPPG
jgi:alkanesulfonate monooxygenase SsuD/methylene tetrahydromethanopterin reductase-like flavin-dependent oxidoreductase (luciferase family)